MKAIVVTDQLRERPGMTLVERPRAAGSIKTSLFRFMRRDSSGTELAWPSTWTRSPRRVDDTLDPWHELGRSGHRTRLWHRGGVGGTEVRPHGLHRTAPGGVVLWPSRPSNLAPLRSDVDFTLGATQPISGLTALAGLFEHGRLQAGAERSSCTARPAQSVRW